METYYKFLDFIQFGLVPRIPWLQQTVTNLEQCLNVPPRYIIQAFVVFIFWTMATSYFCILSKYIIFYLYPTYQTIRVIHTNANKSELIHWLNYWTVFACIMPIEHYAHNIFNSIPFISFIQLIFGYWCYSNYFNGSRIIMERYLLPLYQWIEKNSIDQIGSKAIDQLIEFSNKQNNNVKKKVQKFSTETVTNKLNKKL
ncbi:ER membrane protein DP1/Yop1 [Dermatophagoides pteronyssinus]|uniref:Receptor expression-enhancing protein n=1 Tax=Dermatophagoides pteronyssinus TaxID=6956 RepID=A0ABQ8IZL3_DERPT|nr:ER membrane protein DP1/Yop1 [Dermatophagoides pteronyssinus]